MIHIIIPVKPFGIAKKRLSSVLDGPTRARLGRAVAARTIERAHHVTPEVSIVTPDEGVAAWGRRQGCNVILEPPGAGLNGASTHAIAQCEGRWLVLHADLPLLSVDEVAGLASDALEGWVLAPAHDGGTSAVGGTGSFCFAFGPGSFHRHLAAVDSRVRIVSTVGLALDLDDAHDLDVIRRHPAGTWIESYLG